MSARICGISFTEQSVERLEKAQGVLRQVHEWTGGAFLVTVAVGIGCKVEGLVFSFFSGGYLATLGAYIVSSPYFLGTSIILLTVSTLSWITLKVCRLLENSIRHQLSRELRSSSF